jgi:hypothetical protein
VSNKNRLKFADDGPGGAVVIRSFIMRNRDEAEAHIAAGGAVEESAKRVWHYFVGTFEDVCYAHFAYNFNQIRLEWNRMERYLRRYEYDFRINLSQQRNAIGHPNS